MNPAVTLGLAVAGKFPWSHVPGYVAAQFAGAIVAAFAVWAAYGHGAYVDAHLGAPAPVNGASALRVLLVEALIAFILVFTVISTATDKRVPPGTVAMAISFALSAGAALAGPCTDQIAELGKTLSQRPAGPGVVPPLGEGDPPTYRIWAALADLRTGKIVAQNTAWVRAEEVT